MHDLPAPIRTVPLRPPARATLATAAPSIDELFDFMTEAELRFETLRLRIVDERTTTEGQTCLLYTSPSPRDVEESRMPSSA